MTEKRFIITETQLNKLREMLDKGESLNWDLFQLSDRIPRKEALEKETEWQAVQLMTANLPELSVPSEPDAPAPTKTSPVINRHPRLFETYEHMQVYTNEGKALFEAVKDALTPVIQKYIDAGYNESDIKLILFEHAATSTIYQALHRSFELAEDESNATR